MISKIHNKKDIEENILRNSSNSAANWNYYSDNILKHLIHWVNARLEDNVKHNKQNIKFEQDIDYSFLFRIMHHHPPHYSVHGMHMIISSLKREVDGSKDWLLTAKNISSDKVKITISERKSKS